MRLDITPHKTTAKAMEHSIFTGKKYCFVYIDMLKDWSWDGDKQKVYFVEKGLSVLWNDEELKGFRQSDTVHNYLLTLKAEQVEEIKKLSRKGQRKTFKDKRGIVHDLTKIRKERIDFLTNNDIRFFEINFV